ncbi:hypothetical protein B0H14DRAFT_2546565 [Mycena olivaceomarginata]|nr:hypothetical protein B0H14DRAFT_2546565 [Mycena olivaceomarginata]
MSVEFTVFKGSANKGIVESTTRRAPTGNEVLVKITHSGICGTDEHFKHADMVLGTRALEPSSRSGTASPSSSRRRRGLGVHA